MGSIDQPLNGKILLITGGGSGIGLSLTKQAYEIGAKVLVADIKTTPEFDAFATGKDNILYVQSDVTKWVDFTRIFDECEKKWNDIPDAYGICAGLCEPSFSNFWDDPEQDDRCAQVDVNVNHPIKLTRMALRKSLRKRKRASICIIASIASLASVVAGPVYSASKHAIIGFVKALKDTEPLTGVKITSLLPGAVDTPIINAQQREQFSMTPATFLNPSICAAHMLDLLQKKEYPSGTMLECTLGGTRLIPEWNVGPPEGLGAGADLVPPEVIGKMMAPIVEALRKDREGERV